MCSCGNPLIIITYSNKKTGCYCVCCGIIWLEAKMIGFS